MLNGFNSFSSFRRLLLYKVLINILFKMDFGDLVDVCLKTKSYMGRLVVFVELFFDGLIF